MDISILSREQQKFATLIVGILINSAKKSLFDLEERIEILKHCCNEYDKNIEVISFGGLLVDYCSHNDISFIIRGLRAVSDFEYEITLASINRRLAANVETVFLMARDENLFVSSSLVKEVAMYKGDISTLVPPYVADRIRAKISS
jgi:pantetheine-phosphate adenylyltransferase